MLGVLLAIAVRGQDFPSPPFVREWTHVFDGSIGYREVPQVVGDVAYFTRGGALVAFDLPARKEKWSWKPRDEERAGGYTVDGGTVYVTTQEGWPAPTGRLVALDTESGSLLWSVGKAGEAGPVTVEGGILYTMMTLREIWAVDLKTRKPVWKSDLLTDEKSERRGIDLRKAPIVAGGKLFITTGETKSFALDLATGKEVWRVDDSYSFGQTPIVQGGVVVVSSSRGAAAKDVRTGEDLWAKGVSMTDFAGVFDGRFVFFSSGEVIAVDPRTGEVVWRDRIGDENVSGGNQYGVAMGDVLIVRSIDETVAYSTAGQRLWSLPKNHGLMRPIWHDGERFICAGYMRLLGYGPGTYPPLPKNTEERTALAVKMSEDFELLDDAELERLKALGHEAVLPLADEMVKQGVLYERYSSDEELDSYRFYSVVIDISRILSQVFKGKETLGMVERAASLPEDNLAKGQLLALIARLGDADLSAPKFLKQFDGVPVREIKLDGEMGSPLRSIASSSLPEAVDFMISLLQDEDADKRVRELAYVNLARVGGEKGLKAVLGERIGRRLLPSLEVRMKLKDLADSPGRGTGILDRHKADDGTTWALFTSGVLGSYSDLWIVQQENGKWVRPLFTGLTRVSDRLRNRPNNVEQSYKGYSVSDLVAGAWFNVLVGDRTITSDKDGDGLTDLMEERLGTDAGDPDTDDDGTGDLVDPWPTVKPRNLSDEEAFYAAAFEARYHFGTNVSPAVFLAEEGMEPFEMPGWHGPVVWTDEKRRSSRTDKLSGLWEEGVGFLSFHGDREPGKPPTGQTVTWNEDRTEGSVIISTYYGGLNGTGYFVRARKFGSRWVVIEMEMRYIS